MFTFAQSVRIVLVLTMATVLVVHNLPFTYLRNHIIKQWTWYILWGFAIINNSYQIMTHVLTALKFLHIPVFMIPGGADEEQSVGSFTFHNQLDLWGWWAYFILTGHARWLENILAAVHSSVGLIAISSPVMFQQYYIHTSIKQDGWFFWVVKTGFVIADAVARTCAVFSLLCP